MGKMDIAMLKELAGRGEIDTVIIAGVDMQGRLFGKRVTAEHFLSVAKEGIHTCAINLIWDIMLNFANDNYAFCNWETGMGDMKAVPDLTTMRLYPWCEKAVLVLADSLREDDTPVEVAPRSMLKKQLEKAGSMGYKVMAASEYEFYVFRETPDSVREKNYAGLAPLTRHPIDYQLYRTNVDDWFWRKIVNNLEAADVKVEALKGEWGSGQVELNLKYCEALEMADRSAVYKQGIKEMAAQNNLMATFMAKPTSEDTGSSCHTHISLWDAEGNNLLWDPGAQFKLSEAGRHFLGGMMTLAPDLMIFYCPNINSYKRLAAVGSGAPNTLSWGFDNRSVTFRYIGHGGSCRIENRVPGADANLYLVLAAAVASGLYGIEHGIEPPPPTLKNAYAMPGIARLPRNLLKAVEAMERSEVARKIMGEAVVDHYLTAARNELDEFYMVVTDWERKKYFEFI